MKTKAQLIAQAQAENPKPQYRIENGERIALTDSEYEASLEAWAEMRLEQQGLEAEREAVETARESARAKLAALGLSEAEVAALLGG